MRVLHLAPHLGGGVGKAHAALAGRPGSDPRAGEAQHSYVLLEPPRDIAYVDHIRAAGREVHVAPPLERLTALVADADIVQLEWWNHPRLYAALVTNALPAMRLAAWIHISGLAAPLVPPALTALTDKTLFTSPCSFGAANLRSVLLDRPEAFEFVSSGFGFADVVHQPRPAGAPLRLGYLGTLDFNKMHPEFFDYVDALESDIRVHLWGRYDPEGGVARRAATMRHPGRVQFEGYTADPSQVLSQLDVLVYLLSPDHYGTAENALVEAMSVGAVPIVFGNAAELYLVNDKRTGFVVTSREEFVACLDGIVANPGRIEAMSRAAKAEATLRHTPAQSDLALQRVYDDIMHRPKRPRDFAGALGPDARSWFLSSLGSSEPEDLLGARLLSFVAAKGSLGHFRSCFPQDQSLEALSQQAR